MSAGEMESEWAGKLCDLQSHARTYVCLFVES